MRTVSVRKSQIVSQREGTPGIPAGAPANDTAPRAPNARTQVDCGHLPFLIKRDGTWLYRGSPITRKPMMCLFATILKRDENGRYILESPAERGFIEVEDAPFIAVELDWSGHGKTQSLCFRTNTDQCITAGPEHPIRIAHDLLTCEPTPYLHIRDGNGRFPVEARINRATYYELVALAEPGILRGRPVLGVWSEGMFFSLGDLPGSCGKT
jgi:hypothetical protein